MGPESLERLKTFEMKDLVVGKLLGVGGFSSVYSIVHRCAMQQQHEDLMTKIESPTMEFVNMHNVVVSKELKGPDATQTSDSPVTISSTSSPSHDEPENDVVTTTEPWQGELALKTLSYKTIKGNEKKLKRAAQDLTYEVSILGSLPQHPNIIKLHGVSPGFFDEAHAFDSFLVLEKLEEPLDKAFKRWKKESKPNMMKRMITPKPYRSAMAQAQRIEQDAIDLAAVMKFLHSRRIIFRDLKPANIGMDKDGKIRLFDFACARVLQEGTKIKHRCGTLRYMAPEVAKNEPYGLPADVYSFGMVLWELCALQRPYEVALDREELNEFVTLGPLPSLKKKVIALPTIQHLLEDCWKGNPSERPTFDSVHRRLQQSV